MSVEIVSGKHVRILFDGKKCIHSRGCVLGRPDVFVPNVQGEWIHPDNASVAEVAEIAHGCPSGAIRYEPLDGSPGEAPPQVNTARIRENGPLAFHAELRIAGSDALRATLCRCGASANKPYCDGSHAKAGFAATGEPRSLESSPLAKRDGPLRITPGRDGPLHAEGSLEIVSGTGRTVTRTADAWLCRCGHSQNKPFCDGSHAKTGFKAEP
jgi:CDGSH-type Zn-finger protein/uncharacterized Fe-S cluster protein YjdI